MPPYSFNMDGPYGPGPVPMMTDADKMRAEMSGGPPSQIKEERNKESPSPNEHPSKSNVQVSKTCYFRAKSSNSQTL